MTAQILDSGPAAQADLSRAMAGDRAAFDRLVSPLRSRLAGAIRRLVGHPEDTEDLVQETLIKAFNGLSAFRGDAELGTWMHRIALRTAVDFLRRQPEWRWDAQPHAKDYCHDHDMVGAVQNLMMDPGFRFDAREHIAFCMTCVGRSLPPDEHAALVIKDVFDFSNDEGAELLGLTRSVFRHRVAAARDKMRTRFENLCALVSKTGACWQCEGLRSLSPADRRGEVPEAVLPPTEDRDVHLSNRLRVIRDADLHEGVSQPLHDRLFRLIKQVEAMAGSGRSPVNR